VRTTAQALLLRTEARTCVVGRKQGRQRRHPYSPVRVAATTRPRTSQRDSPRWPRGCTNRGLPARRGAGAGWAVVTSWAGRWSGPNYPRHLARVGPIRQSQSARLAVGACGRNGSALWPVAPRRRRGRRRVPEPAGQRFRWGRECVCDHVIVASSRGGRPAGAGRAPGTGARADRVARNVMWIVMSARASRRAGRWCAARPRVPPRLSPGKPPVRGLLLARLVVCAWVPTRDVRECWN